MEIKKGNVYALVSFDDTVGGMFEIVQNNKIKEINECKWCDWKKSIDRSNDNIQIVRGDIEGYYDISVYRFIAGAFLEYEKEEREDIIAQTDKLLKGLEIDTELDLDELTDEQRYMVYLVVAVVRKPDVLLLKNPYKNITTKNKCLFDKIIKDFSSSKNIVIISCNLYEEITIRCDYYYFIEENKVRFAFGKNDIPYRKKIIIIKGKNVIVDKFISQEMSFIGYRGENLVFLYSGHNIKKMLGNLSYDEVEDILIEDISIRENLCEDYSRWVD